MPGRDNSPNDAGKVVNPALRIVWKIARAPSWIYSAAEYFKTIEYSHVVTRSEERQINYTIGNLVVNAKLLTILGIEFRSLRD